jgi:hypothetical protein
MFFKLSRNWQILLLVVFTALILAIYSFGIASQYTWRFINLTTQIKYASTLFCFAFLLILARPIRRDILLALAFFFIVLADYFLVRHVWETALNGVGVALFLVAQIFFAARLQLNLKRKFIIIDIASRALLSAVALAIVIPLLWSELSFLYVITAIYITQLTINVIISFIFIRRIPLFSAGLLLLLLCDIFVGLQFQGYAWWGLIIPFDFAWLFYVPAKFLIVISLLTKPTQSERILLKSVHP